MSDRNKNIIFVIIIIFSLLLNIFMFNNNAAYENLLKTYEEKIGECEQKLIVFSDKMVDYEINITSMLNKLNVLNDTNNRLLEIISEFKNNSTCSYVIPYNFKVQEVLQDGDLSIYSSDQLYLLANRYDLVITNYYLKNKEPVEILKTINPSIKVLMYVNVHSIDSTIGSLYSLALTNNWVLFDENGNEIYEQNWPFNKCVDIGSDEYRQWLTKLIVNRTKEYDFDGVLGDNTNPLLETKYGVSSQAINPRTGKIYSSTEYRDDMILLVKSIKEQLGNKIYIGNGVGHLQGGSSLGYWKIKELVAPLINEEDGVMVEGFLRWNEESWRSEDEWILDIETLRDLSNDDKYTLAWLKIYGSLPEASDWEQVANFGIMSYLIGVEGSNSYFSISGYDYNIFDETKYTWDDVGFPIEKYHKIDQTGVYTREFTGSIVYVNPTNVRYDFDLKMDMFNLQGNIVRNIILQPHDGILLFRK